MAGENRYRIESVFQAGQVLKAVAETRGAIGPSELAGKLGITVNTAFRMCITLEELGFLKQVGDKYDLGMGMALFWARKKTSLESEKLAVQAELDALGEQ